MKETFTTDVLVKDIRPPVFSALLTYIYTDTLQLQKPEDITELLVLANQVKQVKQQRMHPNGNLDPSSCKRFGFFSQRCRAVNDVIAFECV